MAFHRAWPSAPPNAEGCPTQLLVSWSLTEASGRTSKEYLVSECQPFQMMSLLPRDARLSSATAVTS
jgi:hypothetical protein